MRIGICDDDEIFAQELKAKLEKYYNSLDVLMEIYFNGRQIINRIKDNPEVFDLIFLDIEMPEMDGMSVARKIRMLNEKVPVIFLTSHTEMAMEGYEVNAFRFLSKPVQNDKLVSALKETEKIRRQDSKLLVSTGSGQVVISESQIQYIKAENIYLRIVTQKESYLVRMKMKEAEKQLNQEMFFRIHRSYLINLAYVLRFDSRQVTMTDEVRIPVSKSRLQDFKNTMLMYLRG